MHARTVEHKRVVRAWVADLARRAGATDPDMLAARVLVDAACSPGTQ
ncbi:hypothetical protein AB0E63_39770 [Kribbella sp. NPDC026596]